MECVDAIKAAVMPLQDGYEGYLVGQVMKYLWRFRLKGRPAEDLSKASWYMKRLRKYVKKKK